MESVVRGVFDWCERVGGGHGGGGRRKGTTGDLGRRRWGGGGCPAGCGGGGGGGAWARGGGAGVGGGSWGGGRGAGAAGEVEQALALLGPLPAGAAVLDLCCGVGRHSIELARRGFCVTGVDRFEPFLDRARSAAADAGVSVEWVRDDMRSFRRPGGFA